MSNATAWAYTARDARGKVVKGRLEAGSQGAALSKLRSMGISPITVDEAPAGTGLQMELRIPGLSGRVKLKDLAVASRQMATMIGAGLSLIRTLAILSDQVENKELGRVLGLVRADVEQGSALSDAMAKHDKAFPPLMVHMIRAGETGGFLDQALTGIADNFEADVKLRDEIKSAMTYPVIVLLIAVIAVIGMLLFVVPIFQKMFDQMGETLPVPTLILVVLSQNMVWILPVLVVLIAIGTVWYQRNKHSDAVRERVDKLRLSLPVFGKLFQKIAITRFTRTFSTMLAAGVPILQALSIVGQTSGSWTLENALRRVQESVRQGKSVAAPLADEPIFPPMAQQMIAVGEEAGSMETMLDKIGEFYNAEVETMTKALTSLIEPIMIVVLGSVIGYMVVALYLPIFQASTTVPK
ncbi:type II secretion system F family protein [Galbitalea sp. SE-J8]|uniref:type II secretion system F family protein n=1 Tax=Galbitalea sp. SE-J8 TaxID=3054952 RepID=UPI00259D2B7F|nr:type II secretion system F family protein [Galbitalea sp. SE-J8]MDM4761530.1 type II secretion system F family protein [Galbitalea sp. SE-J8]